MELNNNLTLFSVPPPGSGALTAYIMNILDGNLVNDTEKDGRAASFDPKSYHLIAEAFKHAYAQRTKLADPHFEPEVVEVSCTSGCLVLLIAEIEG